MIIAGVEIGPGKPPYIVAEMSGEHCGILDKAKKIIAKAKYAGADAVKLQLYDPVKLANARGGVDKILDKGEWEGLTLGNLYQNAHTPRLWFPILFEYGREIGITVFSSVFDLDGIDYLETLNCPAYKISSFEIRDCNLISAAASTGKPVIVSTGMASDDDIDMAVNCLGESPAAFLHCISAYPCPIEEAGLRRIAALPGTVVGLSDHTLGSTAAIVATALGASIIEKHITLSRRTAGFDGAFSLEPHQFKEMVRVVRDAYASLQAVEPKSELYRDCRKSA